MKLKIPNFDMHNLSPVKNLLLYYLAVFIPLGLIVLLRWQDAIGPGTLLILIVAYALIYRTWIDGSRLAAKGIISKKDRWKMMLPGMHMKHFTELYLK